MGCERDRGFALSYFKDYGVQQLDDTGKAAGWVGA